MDYDQLGERTVFSDLYLRWVDFMRYVNNKAKTIDENFLREYCSFLGNVAIRFGGIDALNRAPEIPNEAIGNYVRDYEKMLVEWSGYLADIERREARFRSVVERRKHSKEVEEQENCASDPVEEVRGCDSPVDSVKEETDAHKKPVEEVRGCDSPVDSVKEETDAHKKPVEEKPDCPVVEARRRGRKKE